MKSINCQEPKLVEYYASIFDYIDEGNSRRLREGEGVPQISYPHIQYARNQISNFYDWHLDIVQYGLTSQDTIHILYRHTNNASYMVFMGYVKGDFIPSVMEVKQAILVNESIMRNI